MLYEFCAHGKTKGIFTIRGTSFCQMPLSKGKAEEIIDSEER